jgi:hypothetical protein
MNAMAWYEQALAHLPHRMQTDSSMTLLPFAKEIAPLDANQ